MFRIHRQIRVFSPRQRDREGLPENRTFRTITGLVAVIRRSLGPGFNRIVVKSPETRFFDRLNVADRARRLKRVTVFSSVEGAANTFGNSV